MKKKILLIDNVDLVIQVIHMYLSESYDIVYFKRYLDGIKWLEKGYIPDLILTDINLPDMKGDDFLFYIKNNELFEFIPIVILSEEDNTTKRINLLEGGIEDYITKPFNPIELKIRINKILLK